MKATEDKALATREKADKLFYAIAHSLSDIADQAEELAPAYAVEYAKTDDPGAKVAFNLWNQRSETINLVVNLLASDPLLSGKYRAFIHRVFPDLAEPPVPAEPVQQAPPMEAPVTPQVPAPADSAPPAEGAAPEVPAIPPERKADPTDA